MCLDFPSKPAIQYTAQNKVPGLCRNRMLFQLSKHLKIVWFSFQWYRKHHQAHTVFYHYCVRALTLLSLFWDSVRVMSYSWLCSFKTIQEEKFYMDKKEVQDNLKEILVLKMNCLFHNNCSSSLLPSSSLINTIHAVPYLRAAWNFWSCSWNSFRSIALFP